MFTRKTILTTTVIAAAAAFTALPAQAQDIEDYPDESSIILSGVVQSTSGDEFVLDYGEGEITVEMEDWDFYQNEAEALISGESVTVTGFIDDDLFEGREIEAGTVYVRDRFTYYYLDADQEPYYYSYVFMDYDEDDTTQPAITEMAPDGAWVSATGTVTDISGLEMTIDTGADMVQVDTLPLGYNPFDEKGFRQIETGDRIYVTGVMDDNFFESEEIQASSIVRLQQDKGAEE